MDAAATDDTTQSVYEFLFARIIDVLKSAQKNWRSMNKDEQDEVIAQLDDHVRDAIAQAVTLIAADSRPNVVMQLQQVTFKDGVKATLVMAGGADARHQLADAVGGAVVLVLVDEAPYMQGERPQGEPAQADLELAAAMENALDAAETQA